MRGPSLISQIERHLTKIIKNILVASFFLSSNLALAQESSTYKNWCLESGVQDGPFEVHANASGEVQMRGQCSGSQLTGSIVYYYSNGQIERQGQVRAGRPDGLWRRYYESGQLRDQGQWQSGAPDGEWKFWNSIGELVQRGTMACGQKAGKWQSLNDQGQLIYQNYPWPDGCKPAASWRRFDGSLVAMLKSDAEDENQELFTFHLAWVPDLLVISPIQTIRASLGLMALKDTDGRSFIGADFGPRYHFKVAPMAFLEFETGLQAWEDKDPFAFTGAGLGLGKAWPIHFRYRYLFASPNLHQLMIGMSLSY